MDTVTFGVAVADVVPVEVSVVVAVDVAAVDVAVVTVLVVAAVVVRVLVSVRVWLEVAELVIVVVPVTVTLELELGVVVAETVVAGDQWQLRFAPLSSPSVPLSSCTAAPQLSPSAKYKYRPNAHRAGPGASAELGPAMALFSAPATRAHSALEWLSTRTVL